jgi:hypothetical protein
VVKKLPKATDKRILSDELGQARRSIINSLVLKTKFAPIREGCLSEENLVLELRTAEEPAVAEPAITELEPVAV